MVRTSASHAGNRGSNPLGVAKTSQRASSRSSSFLVRERTDRLNLPVDQTRAGCVCRGRCTVLGARRFDQVRPEPLDWEQIRGKKTSIAIAPGLTDRTGNAVAQTELPIEILDVGPAVESHELNDGTNLGTFGDVSFLDGFATITAPCGNGVGGIAGRIQTSGKTKLIVTAAANTSWQTTTLVRAVGKSGRVLEVNSLVNTVEGWARYEFSLENESEVGFSVVPNSMCHWTRAATAKIDRIYAE